MIQKVAWICIDNRRVLFARTRGKTLFYNLGGKPKAGETDVQALCREIKEEVAVDLLPESIAYLGTFSAQADGSHDMVEIHCYSAKFTGELLPSNEIEELAWFSSGDAARTTPTGRRILEWLNKQDTIE